MCRITLSSKITSYTLPLIIKKRKKEKNSEDAWNQGGRLKRTSWVTFADLFERRQKQTGQFLNKFLKGLSHMGTANCCPRVADSAPNLGYKNNTKPLVNSLYQLQQTFFTSKLHHKAQKKERRKERKKNKQNPKKKKKEENVHKHES